MVAASAALWWLATKRTTRVNEAAAER